MINIILFLPIPLYIFLLALSVANAGSRTGWRNKISHPVSRHKRLMQISVLGARGI